MTTSLGIDVSKLSVCCHVLHGYPKGGLAAYWRKSQKNLAKNYPTFYSIPKKQQKEFKDFLDYLDGLQASDEIVAILEPTGYHASKLWAELLKSKGIDILWVGHCHLGRYRRGKGLPNKSDPADALVMAGSISTPTIKPTTEPTRENTSFINPTISPGFEK
ncbi:MAG: hypothetical protein AAGA60_27065 [Cyanobacteria bacterium P01_E01_bin.42]